ncbi:DsrE/DsrF/DrsH-like family protein [candidate division WOR-3 bacterium]|nr:DsrE/DsrF/DrsH-like family protein [candidate division WOR-3 bacterium]
MAKAAFVVNGTENKNIIPALVLGSSAAASGDTVYMFFTPGAADLLKPGRIEEIKPKGYPPAIELWNGIKSLGGKFYLCELVLEVKDMKKEDFRTDIELVGATTFITDIQEAQTTFSF